MLRISGRSTFGTTRTAISSNLRDGSGRRGLALRQDAHLYSPPSAVTALVLSAESRRYLKAMNLASIWDEDDRARPLTTMTAERAEISLI